MKIVCSSNMPYVREAFETLGEAVVLDGRGITGDDVCDADILAIRSTTKVDSDLLAGSHVKFVGTATIGTDHLDIPYLEREGITWCYSPGCNANSVSEYFTAALLCLASRHGFQLAGKTVGVIGVGNVGSLVVKKAETLGLRVLQNDPPRQRAEAAPHAFVPLARVLAESDIVTLHVPLTHDGPDVTFHLADETFFGKLSTGSIFLDSARGAALDTDALLGAMDNGTVSHAVIDTWEGEPSYRTDLLSRTDIATPHIAGHSFEGKVMGTLMVYRAACRFLGIEPSWTPDALLPEPLVPELSIDAAGQREEETLWHIVNAVYDIEADDRRLRAAPPSSADIGQWGDRVHFDSLRKNYPVRREFRFTRIILQNATANLASKLSQLGFQCQLA